MPTLAKGGMPLRGRRRGHYNLIRASVLPRSREKNPASSRARPNLTLPPSANEDDAAPVPATAIALLIALHVSRGAKLDKMVFKRGSILYFAGENPDDVRMRWMATTQGFGLEPEDIDNVYFVPGVFKFTEIGDRIRNEMRHL